MESEASEFPKGFVPKEVGMYVRHRGSTPLGDVGPNRKPNKYLFFYYLINTY